MKTVKELCLGVAVAGVVVGAGSALGCAVASASTDDAGRGDGASAADTSKASESTSRGGKAGPVRQASRTAGAQRNSVSGGVSAADRVTAATPAPAATVVSAPVNPLLPAAPLPAPAPFALAAPASATTVRASSASRTANVTASQVAAPTHVLLIGADGINMDKVLQYAYDEPTSGFRTLMDEGVTGLTSLVGHTTISGPSWSTILTGAWDDKTGVFNNIFNPAPYNSWPTVINLIEYNEPEVDTAVIANWQYINDIAEAGGYPADVSDFIQFRNTWEDTDDDVVARTIELIEGTLATDSAFIFSYQVAVDEAGHVAGGDSPEYRDALINTSENLALIMAAIDAWEAKNPGQEWTVISTTDHGHQPQAGFGHGFQSPDETASWVIFDIEGNDTNDGLQNLGYSNTDITPTIVNLFGIDQRSDFDGVPLQTKGDGIVAPTDIKQSITDALAMYGYPQAAVDFALSVRTIAGAVPYFLNIFVNQITGFLEGVADQEIFLVSTLAQVAEFAVGFIGGALVDVTQVIAGVVARLTGSGVIPPEDDPLPPPTNPGASLLPASAIPASVLV